MEYHADRFEDASLIVEEDGFLVGILPANRTNAIVYSHQGLTFGGFVLLDPSAAATMRQMDFIASHLASQGIHTMVYKALPTIIKEDLLLPTFTGCSAGRRSLFDAM